MANLYEILDDAHNGEAVAKLGREFGLQPEKIEAAVTALLPAISSGLKQSTATVDSLGNLFAVMGQQKDLQALYDDAETAVGPRGVAVGNDVLSVIFGSPDVSQAVVDQAQKFSGVDSNTLKKLLPVLAGILVSGLARSGSASASPGGPAPSPGVPRPSGGGGGLGDILGQIFGRAMQGSPGAPPARPSPQVPSPNSAPTSAPTDPGRNHRSWHMSSAKGPTQGSDQGLTALGLIEAWDAGAYRDVREIWQQAAIQAGDDKFKGELIRGLNALTGHLEYDIGQIRSALAVLSELSSLIERGKRKPNSSSAASVQKKHAVDE